MRKNIIKYILITVLFIILSCQIQFNLDNLLKDAVISDKLNDPEPETLTLPQPQKPWTIMVYMDGDNDLSPATEYDLYEMLSSGGSNSNVNIVALVDQNPAYTTFGGGNKHGIYYVGRTKFFLVQDMPELDTGEGMGTLNTADFFMNFVNSNFNADHYMFIFWNHGSGVDRSIIDSDPTFPPRGIGLDTTQTSGDPTLTEADQKAIIQSFKTNYNGNVNIDIVGYDACLMGMAEIMYQMRDIADYFIASEDNVPGAGYDYGFISQIRNNPGITPLVVGEQIVTYYEQEYQDISYYYVTLSFIDLSYIGGTDTGDLGYLINDFSNTVILLDNISQKTFYQDIRTSFEDYRFPLTWPDYSYFYDLYEFMNAVNNHPSIDGGVKTKASEIMTLITGANLVKYNFKGYSHTGTADAHGISIYIGPATTTYKNSHDMLDGSIGPNTSWDEFLEWVGY